jgi:hypothetical protein
MRIPVQRALPIVLALTCSCSLSAEADVPLAPRYVDALNGFSLRPPAGAQRRREYSPAKLGTWNRRDAKTGAIDLTLTVLHRIESQEAIDIEPYSKLLAQKLAREEQFKVDTLQLTTAGGKQAIDLRGRPGGKVGLWQRQVWVWSRPGEFLILVFSGPQNATKEILATSLGVQQSLQIVDPTTERETRRAKLLRGENLLDGLARKQFEKAFRPGEHWYLLRLADRDAGYMFVGTSAASRDGTDGYEARSFVKIQAQKSGDEPREVRRMHYSTADRSLELWKESLVIGSGVQAKRSLEEGIKQGDLIVAQLRRGTQEKSHKRQLSPAVMGIYLPRAFGMVLPRLVDLAKPQAYAFSVYTTMANDFDMRTLTVLGPETLTIGSREVEAVHVTDQAAADAEPADLWVNAEGILLRMTTADGFVMEETTRAAIIRRFSADEGKIRLLK